MTNLITSKSSVHDFSIREPAIFRFSSTMEVRTTTQNPEGRKELGRGAGDDGTKISMFSRDGVVWQSWRVQ